MKAILECPYCGSANAIIQNQEISHEIDFKNDEGFCKIEYCCRICGHNFLKDWTFRLYNLECRTSNNY